jgi:hypothetical protein
MQPVSVTQGQRFNNGDGPPAPSALPNRPAPAVTVAPFIQQFAPGKGSGLPLRPIAGQPPIDRSDEVVPPPPCRLFVDAPGLFREP